MSGRKSSAAALAGKRVVAAAGIADPDAFVAQVKATGAAVQVATWKDHHDSATRTSPGWPTPPAGRTTS